MSASERRHESARSPSLFARQVGRGRRLRPRGGATPIENGTVVADPPASNGTEDRRARHRAERSTRTVDHDSRPDTRPARAGESPTRDTLSIAFRRLACAASNKFGSPSAFIAAAVLIVGWGISGPFFHFSNAWQLVINTGTTIVTFLMVFLIQSTQNRDAHAIHLKLDELIRSSKARNVFADLEDASDEELQRFQEEFEQLRKRVAAVAEQKRSSRR